MKNRDENPNVQKIQYQLVNGELWKSLADLYK